MPVLSPDLLGLPGERQEAAGLGEEPEPGPGAAARLSRRPWPLRLPAEPLPGRGGETRQEVGPHLTALCGGWAQAGLGEHLFRRPTLQQHQEP